MEKQDMDFEAKFQRFSNIISTKTLNGFMVADRNDKSLIAVLSKQGGKVSHLLHLIIGFLTCGGWWVVWLVLVFLNPRESRIRITIDNAGNVLEEKLKL